MLRKSLCIPAALLFFASQAAVARNVFLTSSDQTNTAVNTYNIDPLSFGASVGVIPGAFTVLPSPNPLKFYVISRSASDSVALLEGRFPSLTVSRRLATGGAANAAKLTPDGRRIVLAGTNGVAIVDTSNDTLLIQMGNLDVGTGAVDVAISADSTRAYILSTTAARLTAIDLTNNTVAGTVAVRGGTAISTSRNGVLYVSAQSFIYELDPATLATRAEIPVIGTPAALQFTSDGRFAIARNSVAFTGRGAFLIDLAARRSTEAAGVDFAFTDLVLVDNTTAYAISPAGTLYVLGIGSTGTLSASQAATGGLTITGLTELSATPEIPRALSVILGDNANLYRLDTTNNQVTQPVQTNTGGTVTVLPAATTNPVAGLLSFNTTQTAAAGTRALPFVVQAYDAAGAPVSGTAVTFTTTTPGVTISTPATTTGLDGTAAATITTPGSGTATVTATVGSRTANFTVNVGDPGLPGTGGTAGAGLRILTGQGQVIFENFTTALQEPLTARLTDATGAPVANAQITWSLVRGSGSINLPAGDRTNANGVATANFLASALIGVNSTTNIIRASAATGQEAIFYISSIRFTPSSTTLIATQILNPVDSIVNARAGETVANAISYRINFAADSAPGAFVGLRVTSANTDPAAGPTASCRGGTALADAQGIATCDLVIGPTTGTTQLTVSLGSVRTFTLTLNVAQGAPATIRILNGNPQSGAPGQTLQPLTIEVVDPAGTPVPNAPVTWEIPGNVNFLPNIQRQTDVNGRASATIILPAQPGPFVVRAVVGTLSATFNLTTNVIAGSLAKVSGDTQSAVISQPFAAPLSVRVVDANNAPIALVPVAFAVTSGTVTLSAPTANSGTDGVASITVTAGANPGPVVITATAGTASAVFNLTVRLAGPGFTADSIVNAAGLQPGVSPGSLALIRVSGVAPNLRGTLTSSAPVGSLPTRLGDVEVLFNNIPAPIYSVSNVNNQESVVVQIPFEVAAGATSVTIRTAGGGSTTVANVTVVPLKPGVFSTVDPGGATYAVATRPDGSFVTSTNPARRGEILRVYGTGFGQTTPATGTNRAGVPNQSIAASVIAGVNNAGVRLVSAEAMEGAVGIYIITLEVPADTATGTNQPIGVAATGADGQAVFANSVSVPII